MEQNQKEPWGMKVKVLIKNLELLHEKWNDNLVIRLGEWDKKATKTGVFKNLDAGNTTIATDALILREFDFSYYFTEEEEHISIDNPPMPLCAFIVQGEKSIGSFSEKTPDEISAFETDEFRLMELLNILRYQVSIDKSDEEIPVLFADNNGNVFNIVNVRFFENYSFQDPLGCPRCILLEFGKDQVGWF